MKTTYVCQQCGASFPKWMGQCLSCGAWNSLVEEAKEVRSKPDKDLLPQDAVTSLDKLLSQKQSLNQDRLSTTMTELNRVLGGGIVPGSVVLLTGTPGVGKSTLLTQLVLGLAQQQKVKANRKIIYLAGEENPKQISLRIGRIIQNEQLSLKSKSSQKMKHWSKFIEFVDDVYVERVIDYLNKTKPALVVVDSVQTLVSRSLNGVAGSVGQVRTSVEKLIEFAKKRQVAVFLVGHVTKDGRVAGPMTLEHMVDVVLDFDGDKGTGLRLLRATKNRFGATDEVGLFQLDDFGFSQVSNPSQLFTSARNHQNTAGAVLSCVIDGSRPLLVEVQALVVPTFLPTPRRVGRGIDSGRLQVLTAVLEKHLKLPMAKHDVFVSIVGGYTTKDPAIDLAIAASLVSSMKNKPMGNRVFVGEVGLLGEIRRVKLFNLRKKEITRLGYNQLVSYQTSKHISDLLT